MNVKMWGLGGGAGGQPVLGFMDPMICLGFSALLSSFSSHPPPPLLPFLHPSLPLFSFLATDDDMQMHLENSGKYTLCSLGTVFSISKLQSFLLC